MLKKLWDSFFLLVKETLKEWREDRASSVAAALAYYAIFSLSPLLLMLALFMGLLIGSNTAEEELLAEMETTLGTESVAAIEEALDSTENSSGGILSAVLWFAVIFWGASGLFGQLQRALNIIWEVRPKPGGPIVPILKTRLVSFMLVVGVGIMLGLSMIVNTWLSNLDFGGLATLLIRPLQIALSLSVITILIAAIYKVLPDVLIGWKDVWVGALFTAVLFLVGQSAVGFYINQSDVGSVYGAAGSLTVILVWIYYSAQILLFGAEFTEVWARYHGAYLRPDKDAEWVNPTKAKRERALSRQMRLENADDNQS